MANATVNSPVIAAAEAAKKAAAEAAAAQKAAQEAQAKADAAQLAARQQREQAFNEYAKATLDAYASTKETATKAIRKAEDAFRDAVLTKGAAGSEYAALLEARADLYVIEQERLAVLKRQGRDPVDRTRRPQPRFLEEMNQVLVQHAAAMVAEKLEDMRDRREDFITRKVGKK